MKKICLLVFSCCLSVSGFAATWYSAPAGGVVVTTLTNWWSNTAGTGTNPTTFATVGDIWIVQSTMGIVGGNDWTVAGSVQINTGDRIQKTATGANSTITIGGNLSLAGTAFITIAGGAGNLAIALAGNLSLTGTSYIANAGTGNGKLDFDGGTTFATPQTITWTSTGASSNESIKIDAGSFAELLSNVPFPTNAPNGVTVAGTLICGTYVMSSASTDAFAVNAAGSLYTANTAGINGSVTAMASTTFAAGASYIYNGTAAQVTGTYLPAAINNGGTVTVDNPAGVTLSQSTTIKSGGILTLTSGNLTIGADNLILEPTATLAGTFSNTAMIIANSTGMVEQQMTANGSFLYPVGDAVPNYTPITLDFTAGTYAAGAYAGINLRNVKHPNNADVTNYLNRYWNVTTSGITAPTYAVTAATYVPGDVVGTEANISTGEYTGVLPWMKFGTSGVNVLTSTGVSDITSAFTGISTPTPTVTSSASTTICNGNSTSLSVVSSTGDPTLTYSWVSSTGLSATTGTPVTATPSVTTTYTVTVTDGNGFTATSTTTITVNPAPDAITGPTNVCISASITLADFTAGGTWSSSAPGTASITGTTATTANVYGNAAGLATIFYNFAGCAVNYVITVNPLPDAITGSPTVCLGSNITLADASGAGTWNSNDAAIASVVAGTGVVTGNELGSANITYTNTASGCFVSSTETVDPNPGAISGPTSACNGATITLNDGSGGGTWSSFAPAIASVVSTGLVTGNAAGNTTISYILSTGCYAIQAVTVNPIPAPITGSSSACTGDSSTLGDITTGGIWSSAAYWIASIGSSSGEIVGLTSGGTTTISYTLGTGCFVTFIDTVVTGPSHILGDTTICVTNTSVLSDSVSGGMWHSSAPGSLSITASNGDILAVAPGVVAITYSVVGCPSVSRNVTVNPIPSPIVGTGNLCDSIHLDLYDFTPGGVWSSSDSITARIVNYPDSGVAIGVSLGETTISYTFSTGCSAILPVTVNPIAPPISGTDTICSTGNAWLTDIVGGGIWSSSNPAIASITTDSGYLAGIVPGVSFIIYTLPTGCYATLLETVVPPVPAILGAPQVCSGSIIDMTDVDSGGTWSSANNYIADVVDTSGVLSGLYHGNVTISYTVSAFKGCYATTSVVVNPLPTPVITYNPGEYQSVSTFNYYTSYQWYNDRIGLIPGAINATLILPGYNDSVYVTVTDTNGCTSSTDWFYNQSTAVKNVSNANINIYPNPASSTLYINGVIPAHAVITGIDGKEIMEQANAKEMNISALTPGIYILTLYDEQEQIIQTQKVIKE